MPRRTGEIVNTERRFPVNKISEPIIDEEVSNQYEDEAEVGSDTTAADEESVSISDLKELIFLGKMRKVVQISGFKFVVTTLSSRQQRELVQSIMKADAANRVVDIKPLTISHCLESINGVPVEDLYDGVTVKSVGEARMGVIAELQATLIDRLYKVYEELQEASNKHVGLEEIKK